MRVLTNRLFLFHALRPLVPEKSNGEAMRKILAVLIALIVCACGNENSAHLNNSTASQQNTGSGNKQALNAVNSNGTQQQTGIANRQSMSLHNASGTQNQTGWGNKQSMTLHDGQGATQNQAGIGNMQTFIGPCDKSVTFKNATMNQAGLFNSQTMVIGNQARDGQAQNNKDCAKASAPN
jgi:hypothetical protein